MGLFFFCLSLSLLATAETGARQASARGRLAMNAKPSEKFDAGLKHSFYKEKSRGRPERHHLFHAHGTESARLLRPWQMSYARVAGQDSIEGSFILNSLNVGLLDWAQVGVNPFLYALPKTRNVSLKLGLYNSSRLAFALGFFHFSMEPQDSVELNINGLSVISNWFLNSDWALSYLVQSSHAYVRLRSPNLEVETVTEPSHYADVQYRATDQFFITSGLSWSAGPHPLSLITPVEKRTLGIGSSLTWKFPKSWLFLYPSLGVHYYPQTSEHSFLLSVFFQ